MTPQYISITQASKQFGPSVATLKHAIERGKLPAYRFGSKGKRWVRPADVQALFVDVQPQTFSKQSFADLCDGVLAASLGPDYFNRRRNRKKQEVVVHGKKGA